jgi:hypothetical protein
VQQGEKFINADFCPLCALQHFNGTRKMDWATPMSTEQNHKLFLEAVAFLGPAAPPWARFIVESKLGPGDDPRALHEI